MTYQTEASFICSDIEGLLAFWRTEFEEHGLHVHEPNPGILIAEADFARITLMTSASGCCLRIDRAELDILPDIRTGLDEHMAEFAPDLAPLTWSGKFDVGIHPPSFVQANVASCEPLGASWYHMTLQVSPDKLQRFAGQNWHFRLLRQSNANRAPVWPLLNAKGTIDWPNGEDTLTDRVFTTRSLDLHSGSLEFDIFRHENGPTCEWAAGDPSGQIVGLMGPGGKAGPEANDGDHVLVGGDETAVPAILRGLFTLPRTCGGTICLLVRNRNDCQPVPNGLKVDWLYRDDGATEDDLVSTITSFETPKDRPCRLWFAASQRMANVIRNHGRNVLHLPRRNMLVTAYWS
ncbi:MAG: siderophore-interacting protein [Pseudomonadota bacterium]